MTGDQIETCVIEVGHPAGTPAEWVNAADPRHAVCSRHREQYDTAFDDYDITWLSIHERNWR